MATSARLYNWRELNKGREYAEALVLEGTPVECICYLHQHDPEGDYLCFEQGSPQSLAKLERIQRQRRAIMEAACPNN